jgi:hypothetical protein
LTVDHNAIPGRGGVSALIQGLAEKWDTYFSRDLLGFSGKVSHRIEVDSLRFGSIPKSGIEVKNAKVGHFIPSALNACFVSSNRH